MNETQVEVGRYDKDRATDFSRLCHVMAEGQRAIAEDTAQARALALWFVKWLSSWPVVLPKLLRQLHDFASGGRMLTRAHALPPQAWGILGSPGGGAAAAAAAAAAAGGEGTGAGDPASGE